MTILNTFWLPLKGLQSNKNGQEEYAAMMGEEAQDYDTVKEAVLH